MRQIQKKPEPQQLNHWRAAFQTDPNFGYGLIEGHLRQEIIQALVGEQGEICAYTGCRIGVYTCHIEHPKPQTHCQRGEDVAYTNMLACFPAPKSAEVPYGARQKGSWPDPAQAHLFVSPLSNDCGARFSFSLNGEIFPSDTGDNAAAETIRRLALDHALLTQLRKEAIQATLTVLGKGPASVDVAATRRRLAGLERAERDGGRLEPFCFALEQALNKHISRLVKLRRSNRRGR